jgi:ribosomal protein S8
MTSTGKDILEGWKEISNFLKVSDKTAMRYAKFKDLPVRKNRAGHPIIYTSVVIQWKLQDKYDKRN